MQFSLDHDTQILARTPRVLRAMLSDLDPRWTDADYGPGTWSPRQIVAHYLDNELTDWIPRLRWILEHADAKPFPPYDRQSLKVFADLALDELLDRFEAARADSLTVLRAQPIDDAFLARRGEHPALGPVTMGELLAAWVAHDLHHIGHIAKALAHQHRDEAGPWRAYLSVLDPPAPR